MDTSLNTTLEFFKNKIDASISKQPKKANKEMQNDILTRSDAKVVLLELAKEMVDYVETVKRDAKEKVELVEKNAKERDEAKDNRINFLEEQILKLSLEQEKSQQYQNRDTLKICGIKEPTDLPPNQHEDTDDTVVKFFDKASISLPKEELSITHRLPSRETGRSTILVKLRSRTVRNSLIRKKKNMRENELLKGEYPEAFIVEHLTPLRSKVAFKLRKAENVEKCWTIDGRLKIVLKGAAATDKPITVDSLMQLTKIPGWTKEDIKKLVFEA